ncbi:MAG TPA: DNA polymerase III subunit gamma and tau [Microlunatus sp.]
MTWSETAGTGSWDAPDDGDAPPDLPEFSQDEALFGEPDEAPGPPAPASRAGTPPPTTAAAPLALYRRYRPDTFADVIGQEHVTEPLQRALANNRVNHAYLFSGPRGCGKTTSARILARALNCEKGPRPEPCGECLSCVDLARGGPGSIDVIEIDAASHGGVDDARDLRERAFFAPVASRYKIYIVDEAHMVTPQGFNALLKLVEEPPPHVKFVFATTEPDKVIGTIRSRTHHYPFRLVPPKVLGDYLAHLCAAEGITVEPAVLPLVVRAGAGSVRDSLSVLDQLLGGADEHGVGYRQAAALLGYTPDSLLDEFVDAFAAGDAGGVFACVDKVIEVGQDPKRFAEDLLRRLRDLVIVAAVPDALTSGLVDVAADQAERLSSQVAALGAGELTRAAEVIAQGLTDMRGTTAPRLHLELMCARVLLPGADVDERGVHARLDRIERRLDMTGAASAVSTQDSAPAPQRPSSAAGPVAEEPAAPAAVGAATGGVATPAASQTATRAPAEPAPKTSLSEQPGSETAPPDSPDRSLGPAGGESDDTALGPHRQPPFGGPSARPSGRQSLTVTDVRRLWPEVLEEVKGRRRFTWILLSQNAQVADVRDGVLVLAMAGVGPRDSFAKGGSEDILREALNEALGVDFRIEAIVDPSVTSGGRASGAGGESGRSGGGQPIAPSGAESATPPLAPEPVDGRFGSAAEPETDREPPSSYDSPPSGSGPVDWSDVPPAPDVPGAVDGEGPAAAPDDKPPVDPRWREQARQQIRPTRQGQVQAEGGSEDLRDEAASINDSDIEDREESHTELLARQLGAEIIGEEKHGF